MGYVNNTWPFVTLQVGADSLVIRDSLLRKQIKLTKLDDVRIEIKKYIPIIGYGVRIYHKNKAYTNLLIFWYVSFHFSKLVDTLKKFGWL